MQWTFSKNEKKMLFGRIFENPSLKKDLTKKKRLNDKPLTMWLKRKIRAHSFIRTNIAERLQAYTAYQGIYIYKVYFHPLCMYFKLTSLVIKLIECVIFNIRKIKIEAIDFLRYLRSYLHTTNKHLKNDKDHKGSNC